MITGVEYLDSKEKADFDRRFALLLSPLPVAAKLGAKATFGFEVYTDIRVGQHGNKFNVDKIKTLDDENNLPINRFADLFRKLGLDETPQIEDIRKGHLSVVGRRQLIAEEYEDMRLIAGNTNDGRNLLAMWDDVVLPYKCGVVSRFALEAHSFGQDNIERRLKLDIYDSLHASKNHDINLIKAVAKAALGNRFKYGSHPVKSG